VKKLLVGPIRSPGLIPEKNGSHEVRHIPLLICSLAASLLEEKRNLVRRGWVGVKGLFEHPGAN
jgi:hypothetical protein